MYYYLASSLPPIAPGDPPPWTPGEYLFHCQGVLVSEDWCELSLVVEGRSREGTSDFAAWWHGLDTQIRNQIARERAGRYHTDVRSSARMHSGHDVAVEHCVTEAMSLGNPLEREKALDRCRWRALDEYVSADRFGFGAILAYAVRLRILDRRKGLTDEAGMERVESFLAEQADKSLDLEKHGDS